MSAKTEHQSSIERAERWLEKNRVELMAHDDPRYLRRLAKELNAHSFNGFYHNGERYNQARFSKGTLQIRMCSDAWLTVTGNDIFGDGNGGTICASRHPKFTS